MVPHSLVWVEMSGDANPCNRFSAAEDGGKQTLRSCGGRRADWTRTRKNKKWSVCHAEWPLMKLDRGDRKPGRTTDSLLSIQWMCGGVELSGGLQDRTTLSPSNARLCIFCCFRRTGWAETQRNKHTELNLTATRRFCTETRNGIAPLLFRRSSAVAIISFTRKLQMMQHDAAASLKAVGAPLKSCFSRGGSHPAQRLVFLNWIQHLLLHSGCSIIDQRKWQDY